MTVESTKQELKEAIEDCRDFLDNLLTFSGFLTCRDHLCEVQEYMSKPKAEYYTLCMAMLQILSRGLVPQLILDEDWDSGEDLLSLSISGFTLFEQSLPIRASFNHDDDTSLKEKAKKLWSRDGIFGELLNKVLDRVEVYR